MADLRDEGPFEFAHGFDDPTEDAPSKPEPDSREWWQQVAAGLGVRVFDLERQLAQLKIDSCNCPNQNNLCPVHDAEDWETADG